MPADVAARTSAAIRSLTDEQLAAVMISSRKIQKRVLPACWSAVKTAAPELAVALDELHARETEADLTRFEALAADHEKQIARAVKGSTGQATAALIIASFIFAAITGATFLAGLISVPFLIAGAGLSAGLLVAGYLVGRRLHLQSGNWMFADPFLAAWTVWDAGIDAAAATALSGRSGRDGLTPDVLRALSAIWTGAGLDASELTLPPKQAPARA